MSCISCGALPISASGRGKLVMTHLVEAGEITLDDLYFFVTARTQEIALRIAVGASPVDVVGLLAARAGRPVCAGVLGGGAWWRWPVAALRRRGCTGHRRLMWVRS